jgi:divalent metal cation (Fe/Co/Zn/Cd) transporter
MDNTPTQVAKTHDARAVLLRRGVRLESATLAWNVVGVVILALAAYRARSVALIGFGLDSLIEIFASVVVLWELTGASEDRERRALRLIGSAFFVLALYLLVQAVIVLVNHAQPAPSPLGIAWLVVTALAMFGLAWGKRVTGRQLGNPVLTKEAGVTIVDGLLAVAILIGLVLNAGFGWWWADPVASLVIVGYGLREGWTAWLASPAQTDH